MRDATAGARRFVALRGEVMRGALGADGPRGEAHLLGFWRHMRGLGAEVAGGPAWQRVAAHDPTPWFGAPLTLVFADRRAGDEEALGALLGAMAAPGLHLRDDAMVEVDARDVPLLEGLGSQGWRVAHIVTAGRVEAAVGALAAGGPWERMRPEDRAPVVELHASVFQEDARWCWFAGFQGYREELAASLAREVPARGAASGHGGPDGAHTASLARHRVVRDALGAPVGHLSVEGREDPHLGRTVDVGVVLAPGLRGRGLLRAAWGCALADAEAWGARVWKGGTMQPAVLGLGARLGRRWVRVGLRRVDGAPVGEVARWPGGWLAEPVSARRP
jgi:hypothetical protein